MNRIKRGAIPNNPEPFVAGPKDDGLADKTKSLDSVKTEDVIVNAVNENEAQLGGCPFNFVCFCFNVCFFQKTHRTTFAEHVCQKTM